jgi:predicted transcriptional regulator
MDILQRVTEIMIEQASYSAMTADSLADAIKKVYKALKWVEREGEGSLRAAEEPLMSGMESIQRNKVICLECGKEFKQLTAKHLASHGMDRKAYKEKYGIPRRQALSARSLSARRRKSAKERGLGRG